MNYKDRWFCNKYKTCINGENCDRAFTPKVQKESELWWKGFNSDFSAPIDFIDNPECYKEIKNEYRKF